MNKIKEFFEYLENNCFFLWVVTHALTYTIILLVAVIGLVTQPAITIIVVFMIWLISMLYQYRKFNKNG